MGKDRTHPFYLSDDEAAREERRTQDMVRSITGVSNPKGNIDRIQVRGSAEPKRTTKVGETENFIVDFDSQEKRVIVYGKEIQAECQFKLLFDREELVEIVSLLKKSFDLF